jgi:SAM-dependent methyltransferase
MARAEPSRSGAVPSRSSPIVGRESNPGYVAFHAPRFAFLIRTLHRYVRTPTPRILDVGPSHLTPQLARSFDRPVDSLGLEPEADQPGGHHYQFDLNETQHRQRWRADLGAYDVIVLAEVLEHLHTAPELALAYLHQLLAPGGLLLLQTPNAVSLRKRALLLLGQNPFERIRIDPGNPGHFREYTLGELGELLGTTGFTVRASFREHYFDARYARHQTGGEAPRLLSGAFKNVLHGLLPPGLREGITIVAERPRARTP